MSYCWLLEGGNEISWACILGNLGENRDDLRLDSSGERMCRTNLLAGLNSTSEAYISRADKAETLNVAIHGTFSQRFCNICLYGI